VERALNRGYTFAIKFVMYFVCAFSAFGQQIPEPQIPSKFSLDLTTAARLRPQLMAQSLPATGRYTTGQQVFERLVAQLPRSATQFLWELRIVNDTDLDAHSLPDGSIYVSSSLAHVADESPGLWAAILSHEISHVLHRDWARRYLYQKSLESDNASIIVLGDPGLPAGSWADSQKASEILGRFCRQLEIEADREGLMLMARAGYDPDFVPALYHFLHAASPAMKLPSPFAMHPSWGERELDLFQTYTAALIEFEHRWPDRYASPGGNPPVVVFAHEPVIRKTAAKQWELQISINCKNLAGTVEVILRVPRAKVAVLSDEAPQKKPFDFEQRQLTGCTSPLSTISFPLQPSPIHNHSRANLADIYILDDKGVILARANVPKLPH
jgi:Zn-dependent protease with chaperone function